MNKRKGINHPSASVKRDVIQRDGGLCLLALSGCTGEAQTTDHRANRGSGGSRVLNHPSVLVAACTACNGAKADAHSLTLLDLVERGLFVRRAATNAETLTRCQQTPIQDVEGDWWWLIDASTRFPALPVDIERHLENVKEMTA